MRRTVRLFILLMTLCALALTGAAQAESIRKVETPEYKVGFYASSCYHIQDEDGKKSGYGYEMMQDIMKYLQCTFDYVGYDVPFADCFDMLENGEIDILSGVKLTDVREEKFAFSTHPAIVATTCMNVKVGNDKVVAGDYSTYNGLRVGLLRRHTYNGKFLDFAIEKGFDCQIIYYETPTELSRALIDDEVDALVNSYTRIPEDESVIENFGDTPYYIITRKEDQALLDEIDDAIDQMNVETPNWRTELYNQYYGSQEKNNELTSSEQALLDTMRENHTVVRAVMNPDAAPYSWYEDGEAQGITAEMFQIVAQRAGLDYEILPVSSREEYERMIADGTADVWLDVSGSEQEADGYRLTSPYLTTALSIMSMSDSSGRIHSLAIMEDNIDVRRIIASRWPDAQVIRFSSLTDCVGALLRGRVDGALLMTYTAQRLAENDVQNRLQVEIVPGESVALKMGVNVQDDRDFYGIWEKMLYVAAQEMGAEVVQNHVENGRSLNIIAYLYDHPIYLVMVIVGVFLIGFFVILYVQATKSKEKERRAAQELAIALEETKKANQAKQDFFSKMSHDIRTPLNVVLGMTQIAEKYKGDEVKLSRALDNITVEGNHLLTLINSILDVNQLESGHVELFSGPFNPADCIRDSEDILRPLAAQKEQTMTVSCNRTDCIVLGDANRFTQIIINIVSNAIKYTNPGGRIDVRLECHEDGSCRFTCTDNGIGMSQEFVSHIFEEYSRAEDSRISKVQGTGLGMAVVKGFTDLMNGKLTVRSRLNEGSTFIVDIPFGKVSEQQRREAMAAKRESEESDERYVGKRVLLAEDNALNAEIATELLRTIGFIVDWAENGEEAVRLFEQSKPGDYFAVFMDMQMPVMNGVEATKKIRATERADSHVPIFAMTANTFASDRNACRDAGMDGYVSKPVSIQSILGALRETI